MNTHSSDPNYIVNVPHLSRRKIPLDLSHRFHGWRNIWGENTLTSRLGCFSGGQEDDAKAAILEKVIKGRQPTGLMLRCKPFRF